MSRGLGDVYKRQNQGNGVAHAASLTLEAAMTTIVIDTPIGAPADVCFDLARDVDAHVRTAAATGERVVLGKTSGLLELGDSVTFEAVHFGLRLRLTSRIVEFERPRRFIDEMVAGPFASLRHVHDFLSEGTATLMRDTLVWTSPLGVLGRIADRLVIERHMRAFMITKQSALKAEAERLARR